ncbi:hypothetical protein [Rhodococcus artemisiae]|uniref:Uncharacterized protein n=1 Tax=Rhodococcus artemisiae TaxID=714159 RepID=A0ABU7LKF3_9NOCA|nr:hypothetical protein [Rhodococcus artemisiae]MEE2061990.1 hypothetical protein [Rhodococcus artemisiae]
MRARLDPIEDFELWYWATLTAGTNAYNACLHSAGLTSDDPVFSTIPGVHLVQQPDGGYARELRGPGDVSHVGWPPIEGEIPEDIQSLEIALELIEEHRDPCIRGERRPTTHIVDECEREFARVRAVLAARVGVKETAS